MPYQWIEPEVFLEHNRVAVYHCYDDSDSMTWYWYTTNPADCQVDEPVTGEDQFDIRDLPHEGLNVDDREQHQLIIAQAIEAGLITGEPAEREPLPLVKIEVRSGIASVVEQPPGVTVEIVGDLSPQSAAPLEGMTQTRQNGFLDLRRVSDRLAYVVTDLNGLISSLVNEEITPGDLSGRFAQLLLKLDQLEAAAQALGDVFWQ